MSSNSLEFMGNYGERLHTLIEKYIHLVFNLVCEFHTIESIEGNS